MAGWFAGAGLVPPASYLGGLSFDFACGDEVYGGCTALRVASNFTLTLAAGTTMTCADAVKKLLKRRSAWEVRSAGTGSKGERWYAWAWLATASPRHSLLVRRHQARSRWFHKRARLQRNYALVS